MANQGGQVATNSGAYQQGIQSGYNGPGVHIARTGANPGPGAPSNPVPEVGRKPKARLR
jgi:hypothetical protein